MFEKRCCELIAFKEEFGHCNVPVKYSDNQSLGKWCNNTRKAYERIQKKLKPVFKLTPKRIQRLEEIGFQWCVSNEEKEIEQCCHEQKKEGKYQSSDEEDGSSDEEDSSSDEDS